MDSVSRIVGGQKLVASKKSLAPRLQTQWSLGMTLVKLLRFLQEREFVPLGSTAPRKVDVRVIAATNRDLAAAVKEGAFREDFFYRLNVFAIEVPPLRGRSEDLLPLAERFLEQKGVPQSRLSPAARDQLRKRAWPGNVR